MILLYPVLLGVAVAVAVRRHELESGRGWRWFTLWAAAGALFTFSLLTGLSIGLLLLPAAAVLLLATAWLSPHLAEAAGFVVGVGAVPLLVGLIAHPGADWMLAGAGIAIAGLSVRAMSGA